MRNLLCRSVAFLFIVAIAGPPARAAEPTNALTPTNPAPLPLLLTAYYHTNFFHPKYKGPAEALPKGVQKIDGVPFQITGQAGLYGRTLASRGTEYPPNLSAIAVNEKFDELHLVHHAFWNAEDGTTLATVRLNFDEGPTHVIPINYGEHVRDWFRLKYEERQSVSDPGSKIYWSGQHAAAARLSGSMRMFKSVFTNPHPERVVKSIEFYSARAPASYCLIAATICHADTNRVPDKPLKLNPPDRTFDGTAKVNLVDANTGHPIAGVLIDVSVSDDTGGYPLIPYVTGAAGVKTIRYPTDAITRMSMSISADGYVGKSISWRTTPFPAESTIKLDPAVSIGGIVVDEQSVGISGVKVSISGGRYEPDATENLRIYGTKTTTDIAGRWKLSALPAKFTDFSVHLDHTNYPKVSYMPDTRDKMYVGKRVPLKDFLDQTAVLKLERGLTLTGTVVNKENVPVTNAQVSLGPGNYPSNTKIKVDDQGHFVISNLLAGDVYLNAQAGGYAPFSEKIKFTAATEPVQVVLDKGHLVKGRVLDKAGLPVEGAKVANDSYSPGRTLTMNVATDAEGRFKWNGAPEESFSANITKEGYAMLRIYLQPDADEETYTLIKAGEITGTVTDADTHEPIAKFAVTPGESWSIDRYNWQEHLRRSGSAGRYSLKLERSDTRYILKAEADGYLPILSAAIKPSEEEQVVNFELHQGNGPGGTVLLPNGQPAAGAEVALLTRSGSLQLNGTKLQSYSSQGSRSTRTDAEGKFQLKPQPDATALIALHDQGFAQLDAAALEGNPVITLQAWGRIEGIVVSGGQPLAGISMLLSAPRNDGTGLSFSFQEAKAETDEQGRFKMDHVPPGERALVRLIQTSEHSWSHSHTTPVQVNSGEVTAVVLGDTGRRITGRIAFDQADPQAEAPQGQISISTKLPRPTNASTTTEEATAWQSSPEYKEAVRNSRHYSGQMNDDGTFRLEEIPPGTYTMHIQLYKASSGDGFGFRSSIGYHTQDLTVPESVNPAAEPPLDLGAVIVKPPPRRTR